MKKRILAFVCLLVILVGVLVVPATAATKTEQATTYDVGYASKNLNPWVSKTFDVNTDVGTAEFLLNPEETTDKKIYPHLFSQNGNQIDWRSVVTKLYDDNGDGSVDHNDGIFATCTAVTYGKGTADEKTVLFITADTMKAWSSLVKAVRNKIVESDWGKSLGITKDAIMFSANHNHSGPQLDGSFNYYIDKTVFNTEEKQTALKKDRENYYNWVVDRIAAAAEESIVDQAPATMSKGSVDAKEATAALNYNGGNGYHMNTIRHYERTLKSSYAGWSGKVSSIYANTAVPSHDKLVAQLKEYNHDAKNVFNVQSNYTTTWSMTDEADNTMYVLRFTFENPEKDPVVFVNWRAHCTMNSGVERSSLSGDYATGLRTVLAENGYRAAFFQGAAGNAVAHPSSNVYSVGGVLQKDKMDWLYEATDKASSPKIDKTKKTFIYGKMLAEVARYCMEQTDKNGNPYMVETPVGAIKTVQASWVADKQKYDDNLLAAAIALREEVMNKKGWTKAQFESEYRTYFEQYSSTYFPYYYKTSGKTAAIINSRYHYQSIYAQAKIVLDSGKEVSNYTGAIELDAIMLGKNVAFITSPNELADYYHNFESENDIKRHTAAEKEAHNDWAELNDSDYGMPFLLGYSNQNSGYIANWLDFKANTADYATITGLGADGYMLYSPGTYESMTSSFAAGQGEKLIGTYKKLLNWAESGYVKAECQHCGYEVEWKPLMAGVATNTSLGSGHFYLTENALRSDQAKDYSKVVGDGEKLCLNLNGYILESEGRTFSIDNGGELCIIDTPIEDAGPGGVVRGYSGNNNPGGGVIYMAGGRSKLNIYGGALEFVSDEDARYGIGVGGIISMRGEVNIYGGHLKGTQLVDSSYDFGSDGTGGAIYIYGGRLNVYGGRITSGSVPADLSTAKAPCIFVATSSGKVKLANDAVVDNIYFQYSSGDQLTIDGEYTGTATVTTGYEISEGKDFGNIVNNGSFENITSVKYNDDKNTTMPTGFYVQTSGTDLILTKNKAVAMNGSVFYATLQDAIANYNADYVIKLLTNIEEDVVINNGSEIVLDLNGHSVKSVSVTNGRLWGKDTATDDYDVSDGQYGKILSYSGNILGYNTDGSKKSNAYMKVNENGALSFHGVNLEIFAMNLRPVRDGVSTPSVYYQSYFKADQVAAAKIKKYGIAMSVIGNPTASDLETDCKMSGFTVFNSGPAGNTGSGTLLKGIMKPTNDSGVNYCNANIPVYGVAYVLTDDGYMLGSVVQRTLVQQTEYGDAQWSQMNDTQKSGMIAMYETYTDIMKTWELPNLFAHLGLSR